MMKQNNFKTKIILLLVLLCLLFTLSNSIAKPKILWFRASKETVELYSKYEVRISLEAKYVNPFDPEQIDVWADFTPPSGKKVKICGIYNQTSADTHFMVRFAPMETGTWKYVLNVKDSEGTTRSTVKSFNVEQSSHHGFITIAPNKRYFNYSDGTSYYGVGMWYNDGPIPLMEETINAYELDKLKRNGANFIAIRMQPIETLASGVGRYDQRVCERLDEIFELCGARDINISLNIWFHNYLSETIWDMSWLKTNPYRLVTNIVNFYGNEKVWNYQLKLFRYIIARWGYSRHLFNWYLIDEIDGTDGFVYKHDEAEEFCRKMHRYFKENDPYGRPTLSSQSGGSGKWWPEGYRIFDIATRELYEAQGHPRYKGGGKVHPDSISPVQYSYRNFAIQAQNLWNGFIKPGVIGETMASLTYHEPGMPSYIEYHHNAMWVSLVNGLSATPFFWEYWPDVLPRECSDYTAYPNLDSMFCLHIQGMGQVNDIFNSSQMYNFSKFVSGIDFANADYQPIAIKTSGHSDAWVMASGVKAFGWIVNSKEGVAREEFTINGLSEGKYDIQLFRTWAGDYMDKLTVSCVEGKLSFTIPELMPIRGLANHIGNDVAFKIIKKH
jgi:hypothetical protein